MTDHTITITREHFNQAIGQAFASGYMEANKTLEHRAQDFVKTVGNGIWARLEQVHCEQERNVPSKPAVKKK